MLGDSSVPHTTWAPTSATSFLQPVSNRVAGSLPAPREEEGVNGRKAETQSCSEPTALQEPEVGKMDLGVGMKWRVHLDGPYQAGLAPEAQRA